MMMMIINIIIVIRPYNCTFGFCSNGRCYASEVYGNSAIRSADSENLSLEEPSMKWWIRIELLVLLRRLANYGYSKFSKRDVGRRSVVNFTDVIIL